MLTQCTSVFVLACLLVLVPAAVAIVGLGIDNASSTLNLLPAFARVVDHCPVCRV